MPELNGQPGPAGRFARWHVEPRREQEQEAWLLTYLDMLTLLLVMLVVMLALAGKATREQENEAANLAANPDDAPLALHGPAEPIAALAPLPALAPAPHAASHDALAMELGEDIEVIVSDSSISFRISSEILFGSGQAELADAGLDVIDRLIPTLAASQYRIVVEGHTDDRPIQTERFPSNWELSAGRASSVVRYLQLAGIEASRLTASGFAATQPLGDNASDQGRAANRRVELIMQRQPNRP